MAAGGADTRAILMAARHRRPWIILAAVRDNRHTGTDRPGRMRPDRERPAPSRDQRLTRQGLRQHKGQKQTTHGVSRLHGMAMPWPRPGVHYEMPNTLTLLMR